MSLPLVVVIGGLFVYPILQALYTSFTNLDFTDSASGKFVGLANYVNFLTSRNGITVVSNTLKFAALATIIECIIGLALALLLNSLKKSKAAIRSALLIPMMFAPVVAGYEWRWIFNDQGGLANYLLQSLGIIDAPIGWLIDSRYAFWSVLTAEIWWMTPFLMLIFLGGLQSLPQEPYEAAKLDGAGPVKTFVYVTLPMLRPVLAVGILLRLMDAFQVFDLPFIMTFGGPDGATETINTWSYKLGFRDFLIGRATSVAMIALVIALLVGAFLARQMLSRMTRSRDT